MSTVPEIEKAIAGLPPEALAELRIWFQEFDSQTWDEQIESDVATEKLDSLADEAIEDLKQGKAKRL